DFRTDYQAGLQKLANTLKLDVSSYRSLTGTTLAFHILTEGTQPPSCPEVLSKLPLAGIRKKMCEKMQRHEVRTIWFDTLEDDMEKDMTGLVLGECVVELM